MNVAVVGVSINILGSWFMAFGYAMLKLAHNQAHKMNVNYLNTRTWWIGLTWAILAQPWYVICASMASQSTLSVVGPVGILVNIIFAYYVLNEKIVVIEIIGIGLFVPGIIFTLYFASMKNHLYNQVEFNKVLYQPLPLFFLIGHIILQAILHIVWYFILKQHPAVDYSFNQEEEDEIYVSNVNFNHNKVKLLETGTENSSIGDHHSKGIFRSPKWRLLPLIVFPYTGAFYAAVAGAIVRVSFGFLFTDPPKGYHSNFDNVMPKVYLALLPVFALLCYYYFNLGLKYYDSIYMAPLIKILGMIHKLMSGSIYLNELNKSNYTPVNLCFFAIGIMICILGILMLMFGNYTNSIRSKKSESSTA